MSTVHNFILIKCTTVYTRDKSGIVVLIGNAGTINININIMSDNYKY